MNTYLYVVIALFVICTVLLAMIIRILRSLKELKDTIIKLSVIAPSPNNDSINDISSVKELIIKSLYYDNEDGAQSRLVMIKKDINDIHNNVSDIKSLIHVWQKENTDKMGGANKNADDHNMLESNIHKEIILSEINTKIDILIEEMKKNNTSSNLPIL